MKLILLDIDGVLTDGCVTLDIYGNETKTISYRDLDAIGIGRRAGIDFAFVTGEDTEMVQKLAHRFNVERIYTGAKDKTVAIEYISKEVNLPLSELIYVGDSDRDAPALAIVGLGIVPNDASNSAKIAAQYVTNCNGGKGVLLEIVNKLISGELSFPEGEK